MTYHCRRLLGCLCFLWKMLHIHSGRSQHLFWNENLFCEGLASTMGIALPVDASRTKYLREGSSNSFQTSLGHHIYSGSREWSWFLKTVLPAIGGHPLPDGLISLYLAQRYSISHTVISIQWFLRKSGQLRSSFLVWQLILPFVYHKNIYTTKDERMTTSSFFCSLTTSHNGRRQLNAPSKSAFSQEHTLISRCDLTASCYPPGSGIYHYLIWSKRNGHGWFGAVGYVVNVLTMDNCFTSQDN